jgi:hypothetical protein
MRGKAAFWIIVAALVVPSVGMSVFAWRMVGQVRREAAVTDARLRELAWSCLAYADEFGGFPTSEAALRAFPVPGELKRQGEGFPATRAATLAAAGPSAPPTLDECLDAIEVEWPIVGDVQPILRSKGKPTLQGTVPTVGQWLFAMAEKVRKG